MDLDLSHHSQIKTKTLIELTEDYHHRAISTMQALIEKVDFDPDSEVLALTQPSNDHFELAIDLRLRLRSEVQLEFIHSLLVTASNAACVAFVVDECDSEGNAFQHLLGPLDDRADAMMPEVMENAQRWAQQLSDDPQLVAKTDLQRIASVANSKVVDMLETLLSSLNQHSNELPAEVKETVFDFELCRAALCPHPPQGEASQPSNPAMIAMSELFGDSYGCQEPDTTTPLALSVEYHDSCAYVVLNDFAMEINDLGWYLAAMMTTEMETSGRINGQFPLKVGETTVEIDVVEALRCVVRFGDLDTALPYWLTGHPCAVISTNLGRNLFHHRRELSRLFRSVSPASFDEFISWLGAEAA